MRVLSYLPLLSSKPTCYKGLRVSFLSNWLGNTEKEQIPWKTQAKRSLGDHDQGDDEISTYFSSRWQTRLTSYNSLTPIWRSIFGTQLIARTLYQFVTLSSLNLKILWGFSNRWSFIDSKSFFYVFYLSNRISFFSLT